LTAATPAIPSVLHQAVRQPARLYRRALLFSLFSSFLMLAPTLFMLEVYDRVINSRNPTTLAMLLLAVVGAYVVMELLESVRAEVMGQAALEVDRAVRSRLFDAAFDVNLKRGGRQGSTQVFSDLKTLREFLPSQAVMAMMDAPTSLVFLVIVFIISPWLGLLALIGALVQVAIAVRTELHILPRLTQANLAAIQAQGYASGMLRQTGVIEAMGMMGAIQRRWMTMQRRVMRLQGEASDVSGLNAASGRFVQTLQSSLILGAACWLSLKGGLLGGGGMMIVASTLGGRVLTPLAQLVTQWRTVVNARDAYSRLDAVLGTAPAAVTGMPLAAPHGHLAVDAVMACAPGSAALILRGVSFSAQPGELLVVVGPSASGKTTLARLLVGVWPSSAGKVRLDGVDVHAWNKDELGPHVGYLPQGVELFDGTVAENIARFGQVDADKVRAAAEMVGLHGMIEALPQGYGTRIGEEGAFLSGGQRQRVGLARALYGMPRFVVLDEPNSSLDEAGDQALIDTLRRLKAAGSTAIVMSHRTSILPVADKMLVLRDGQVALFGSRDEVMAALQRAVRGLSAPVPGHAHKSTPVTVLRPGGSAVAETSALAAAPGSIE